METDYNYEESLDPWSSEWYDTEGYDDEYNPEETDWTENYYETSDYDNNDSTLPKHIPALLDQPVERQEEDTSKLETVQEAVAAANAVADMSRRTWTQARQLMKDSCCPLVIHDKCCFSCWLMSSLVANIWVGKDTLVSNSLHASTLAVCGSSVKQISHSWHIVLDTGRVYTFPTPSLSLSEHALNMQLEPELTIVIFDTENLHCV